MRHFWFVTKDVGGQPHFPPGVVPRKASYVAPYYLTGTTAGHAHMYLGGTGRPDARLSGTGSLHYHDFVQYDGTWYQFTTGAASHSHELPEQPSWWLMCALLHDADVPICAADPDMFRLGEIVDGEIDDSIWPPEDFTTWENRFLNGLYVQLPGLVATDRRLVTWAKNLANLFGSERGYRCPGESL